MNVNPNANEELDYDTHDTANDYCPHGQEWNGCCEKVEEYVKFR